MKVLFLILTFLASHSTHAAAEKAPTHPAYDPQILQLVLEKVEKADKAGEKPVVLLDIDDTLTDLRSRRLVILHEFAADSQMRKLYPQVCTKFAAAKLADVMMENPETLQRLGVATDDAAAKAFDTFWRARFFFSPYCEREIEIPGAAAYVQRLHKTPGKPGAHLVYLTGRDEPRMGKGTRNELKKLHFPFDGQTTLLLKPHEDSFDLKFKESQFDRVKKLGKVIAVFENEPVNLNSMSRAFPDALVVFVDSEHSAQPAVPVPSAHWIKDYQSK